MSPALTAVILLGLLTSNGCQSFEPPPVHPNLRLDYPSDVAADLPHHNPGDSVSVAVVVRSHNGTPFEGAEFIWDDGLIPVRVHPEDAVSVGFVMATAVWIVPPLPVGVFSKLRVVRAYLPGADNSPLEYRSIIMPCSRRC